MYFDYAATTPLDARVQKVMIDTFEAFGNPSAIHSEGRKARAIIDECHYVIAQYIHAKPDEVIVCGSGTEANNIALHSVCTHWINLHKKPGVIITSPLEHKAVSMVIAEYAKMGWKVHTLPLQTDGTIDINHLEALLKEEKISLVSVQWVNSETGLLQPIGAIAKLCKEYAVPYHCDGMQGTPHEELPTQLPDLLTCAPHKFYGPKGIGILFARKEIPLVPLIFGGGQEYGVRSGTENTVVCAGTTIAIQLLESERLQREQKNNAVKMHILDVLQGYPQWQQSVKTRNTISSTIHLIHNTKNGEDLLMKADLANICISTGSACSIGASETSNTLIALGYNHEQAKHVIRISYGEYTTQAEVDALCKWLEHQ